jgi:tetratricopeptide (TPR) repeat protein
MVTEDARYGTLFAHYLAQGLEHSLTQVQADPYKTPEEVRGQAWHLLSFALRTPGAWPLAADLLLALSPKMLQAGYREQWLHYLEEGLACARDTGDERTAAALLLEIGELLRHLGRLPAAEVCFQDALGVFAAAGDTEQAAAAQVCLANLAFLREEWANATAGCQEALALVPDVHPVRARAWFLMANMKTFLAEYNDADHLFLCAQEVWEKSRQLHWVTLCQQNRAWLAAQRGDTDLARQLFSAALADFRALNNLHSQGVVFLDWGIVEYSDNKFAAALDLYHNAEKIFRKLNDVRYLAMTCNNIGLLHRQRGQWVLAEPYYVESISLWRELGTVLARISAESGLARLLWARGDARQALALYERLLAELAQTERNAEHRRLYRELCDYKEQALANL